MIIKYASNHQNELYSFYSETVSQDGIFVCLDLNEFLNVLNQSLTFLYVTKEGIHGFIMTHEKNDEVYITMNYGNHVIKHGLLTHLVNHLKPLKIKTIWIHFFNPISLAWYPKVGVIHPCYQGEVIHSAMHQFYLDFGFLEHSIQDTFYLNLALYQEDPEISTWIESHQSIGVTYEIYNRNIHLGFLDFLDQIQAPHWKKALLENDCISCPLPLLVALENNVVIGFAGPLKVESYGRGYFAGIGVLETHRNQKIGKVLFLRLVAILKEMNASYMTLFTGRENKARHIYMGAGFEIVKSFVTLKMPL